MRKQRLRKDPKAQPPLGRKMLGRKQNGGARREGGRKTRDQARAIQIARMLREEQAERVRGSGTLIEGMTLTGGMQQELGQRDISSITLKLTVRVVR